MRHIKPIAFFLALIPLLLFVYVAFLSCIDPEKDPRYSQIKLDYTPSKVSSNLLAFITTQSKDKPLPSFQDDLTNANSAKHRDAKGWFHRLESTRNLLQKYEPFRLRFLQVLHERSCLPHSTLPPTKKADRKIWRSDLRFIRLIRGSRLVGLRAIADTQSGNPDAAAQAIHQAASAQLHALQHCNNELLGHMILIAGLDILFHSAAYPLSHPQLSPTLRAKFLDLLKQSSQLPLQQLANVWRVESRLAHTVTAQLNHQSDLPVTPMAWPLWDQKQFLAWSDELHRYRIWAAQQPFSLALPRTNMDDFLEKVSKVGFFHSTLSYNSVGRILFSIAQPSTQRYHQRWHQHRCFAGFQLARALHHSGHKGSLPLNPLTQKPYDLQTTKPCGFPSPPSSTPKNTKTSQTSSISPIVAHPWPTLPTSQTPPSPPANRP